MKRVMNILKAPKEIETDLIGKQVFYKAKSDEFKPCVLTQILGSGEYIVEENIKKAITVSRTIIVNEIFIYTI